MDYARDSVVQNQCLPVICAKVNDCVVMICVKRDDQLLDRKVHRVDHGVILVTTGLVGDGRALAQAMRLSSQRIRIHHGEACSPSVEELAEEVARIQHELTRTAGARPLAVTAMLLGCNCNANTKRGSMELFQSEPGGSLEKVRYCVAGRGKCKYMQALEGMIPKKKKNKNYEDTCNTLGSDGKGIATSNDEHRIAHVNGIEEDNDDTMSIVESIVKFMLEEEQTIHSDESSCNNSPGALIDIWVLNYDPRKRGSVRIRCAPNISSHSQFVKIKERLISS